MDQFQCLELSIVRHQGVWVSQLNRFMIGDLNLKQQTTQDIGVRRLKAELTRVTEERVPVTVKCRPGSQLSCYSFESQGTFPA